MMPTRAFQREGLLARTAPFIAVAVGQAATVAFQDGVDRTRLVQGFVAIGVLIVGIFCVPWGRLPRWTDAIIPLAFFVAIALLRERGRRTIISRRLACAAAGRLVRPLRNRPRGGSGSHRRPRRVRPPSIAHRRSELPAHREHDRGFNLLLVASMIGFVVHRLVVARACRSPPKLARLADTDHLTGLPNRGAGIRKLDQAVTLGLGRTSLSVLPSSTWMA